MINQELISKLGNINTHTSNLEGINKALIEIQKLYTNKKWAFKFLNPEAPILQIKSKSKKSKSLKVLLVGHIDTVFQKTHPFQSTYIKGNYLHGPGVLDMKSGLLIMLESLKTLSEQKDLYWEVLITSDEETGSVQSKTILEKKAKEFDIGLVFEPRLESGHFVANRKGSCNLNIECTGKAAHVGRQFNNGISAILKLNKLISKIGNIKPPKGAIINIGLINGGTALNVVPDQATCQLNFRADKESDMKLILKEIKKHARPSKLNILNWRPPKVISKKNKALNKRLEQVGKELKMPIKWRDTGGVCDGNILANAGLPTIDTMGGQGKGIHTSKEKLKISSVADGIKLTVALIKSLAKSPI